MTAAAVTLLTNPAWLAADVLAKALDPPPPVDLNAWAAANVVFGQESPLPGPYDPGRFPFFRRILEVLGPEHPSRVVVLLKSAQLGGTVLAQIFVGGSLDLDPSPFLYVVPTEPNAQRWAKTKWRPFVRGCASLRRLFPAGTSRDASNSTLYQERRDGRGFLQISGANSEASLSMVSMPRQVQDDLAKWEMNNAGDPETQADSRSKAFECAKIFKISTPLVADNCRITRAFKRSTQEHFHVPCPHCGHRHPLEWDNMLANLDEQHPERAHFTCPACGGVIEERHRPQMLAGGCWVAHNPGAAIVGFYLWAAYSPLERWAAIAEAWLAAKGDPAKEQVFLNDMVGRAYEAAGESPPWESLRDRAEAALRRRGVVPRGGLLLCLGLDCQDDRVEWQLVAFGRELRRYVVDYGVVDGSITDEATHKALDALLARTWRDFQGQPRGIDAAAIDGNAWTEAVFDWVKGKPQSQVIMVRGVRGDHAPVIKQVKREVGRDGRLLRYRKRFFNVGVSAMKSALYKQLKKADPLERGYCDFPSGLGDEYFIQLCAERRLPVKRKDGSTEYRWVLPANVRNEALDTMLYAEAAATRAGWRANTDQRWDELEAEREAPPPPAQLDLEDALTAPVARPQPLVDRPAEAVAPAAPFTPKLVTPADPYL